jgi:hypothetical protein
MKFLLKTLFFLLIIVNLRAQVVNTGVTDTISGNQLGNISIGAYLDLYYGYSFNNSTDDNVNYFVSMNKQNQFNLNLGMIDVRYKSDRLRARFAPGFGTFNNANYVNEPGLLKNIIEANAGVKLFKNKEIWVDVGILGSPYTNESCISKDHLMYTRSFAPEYVPYYLAGVKVSLPINNKFSLYLYLLNGWQQIQDLNSGKSFGTQLEYRPNDKNLINWNTYLGDERSKFTPDFRMRYFTDIYWLYNPNDRLAIASCAYVGIQQKLNNQNKTDNLLWWQANFSVKYNFTKQISLSGRVEYFNDENQVQIINNVNPMSGFQTFSSGLCLNVKIFNNAMFRLEGRQFYSIKEAFKDSDDNAVKSAYWLMSNISIWF